MRISFALILLVLAACGDSDDAQPAPRERKTAPPARSSHVVAVVRSTGWLDDMAKGAGGTIYIHHEKLAADVVVVYAKDDGESVEYLTKEQAEAFEADAKKRRLRAVETMSRLLPDLARDEVGKAVYALQGDPNYTSSVLLMEAVWRAQAKAVKGDLVAVVPTRGTVLFTGSKDTAAIQRMREVAAKAAAEATYPISEMLLRRWGEGWIAFE